MKKSIKINKFAKLLIILLIFANLSCLSITRMGIGAAGPVFDEIVDGFLDFESVEIAKKGIPGMALLVSSLVELAPENPKLAGMAGMLYTAWALLAQFDDKKFADRLLVISQKYSIRSIKLANDNIKEALENGKHLADVINEIEDDDEIAPGFWYALATGLLIMNNLDNPYLAMGLSDVTATIGRIRELDPAYFFYTPVMFEATLAAASGPLMGYTTEQANKMFQDLFAKLDKKCLLHYVFYAQYYAATMLDEKLFDDTINYILDTPNNVLEGGQLLNDIGKMMARDLKSKKNKLFP